MNSMVVKILELYIWDTKSVLHRRFGAVVVVIVW